jgi:hypothetical protein
LLRACANPSVAYALFLYAGEKYHKSGLTCNSFNLNNKPKNDTKRILFGTPVLRSRATAEDGQELTKVKTQKILIL